MQRLSVTMQTVAQHAGVSRATVSRVLSGADYVEPASKAKVLAAVEELGYVRNAAASQLAMRGSNLVGLLLRDAINPAYAHLQDHLLQEAHAHDMFVVTASTGRMDPACVKLGEVSVLDKLIQLRPAGLIVSSGLVPSDSIVPLARQIPTIVVPRPDPCEQLHVIGYDEVADGRIIAEAVLRAGHRHVAVTLLAKEVSATERLRAQAMSETLQAAGVTVSTIADPVVLHDHAALVRLLKDKLIPAGVTALMFTNDARAIDFLIMAEQLGLHIPEECSVTGFDGIGQAVALSGLTTVRNPLDTVAKQAVAVMGQLLAGNIPAEPVRELYEGTLIAGRTLAQCSA
ncbi:LacI family DNA-binding transcriptional regulator [Corynebacterium choanae]|uniref:HTH-type transcriptional regulator DegA n=1 Tax=Corynebacterium choanae TaxID=1862358 RepID=A0A3G6JA82_9CORY|nr:LacI family DNA-binding transcriptional regulator [Corynebacterium choanae]AZA14703.1 HTH-type transcriptional regulator DegA [Corynebacterium choanae]